MNITQETNNMGIFVHFEPDIEEDIRDKQDRSKWKKIITSEIYKRLYDSKKFDRINMREIYDLLKEDLNG